MLGVFADRIIYFGSLLKKLLFVGRALLLRLWVLGTHVRKRLGRLGEQPEQLGDWGLATLCWCRNAGSRASKPVVAQHFVLGMFADLSTHFGSLLKKLLFLGRTLLLRLWVLGAHVRKRLGWLEEQPEQLGATKAVLVQDWWLQG